MQAELLDKIQQRISVVTLEGNLATDAPPLRLKAQPVGGGNISTAYRLQAADGRQWFCKVNRTTQFPGLFTTEKRSLERLKSASPDSGTPIIRVPDVLDLEPGPPEQFLILEWIGQGPRTDRFWRQFGEQLARLHQVRPEGAAQGSDVPQPGWFGLETDNYMGALTQVNTWSADWAEFLVNCRFGPQVKLAADRGLLNEGQVRQFERLYPYLPEIFPDARPSLLHGDLWSGNFLCDAEGLPVLIDPAVYFGYAGMDLAMTTLFGGFERGFYEAYAYHSPLPANHREQWDICNLYPLLIHLNLFGKSYLGSILDTIERF